MIYLKGIIPGSQYLVFYLGSGKPFECFHQNSHGSIENIFFRSEESYLMAKEELTRQGISIKGGISNKGRKRRYPVDPKIMDKESVTSGYNYSFEVYSQDVTRVRKILREIGFYQIYVIGNNFIIKR